MYIFLIVLTAALAAGWLAGGLLLVYGFRRMPWLRDSAPLRDEECPTVSLLVGARNEAAKLPAALETWLSLDYPRLEIVAVNDRSTDATGTILDEAARNNTNLKVVHIDELPPGWLGKCHALTKAYEQSTGEWLVLTDADVRMASDTLRRALSLVRTQGWDHAPGLAQLDMTGFWEKTILPYFGLGFMLSERPWESSNPRSKAYIGVGAFQLIRRSTYEAVGTHRRLALEVVEDMKLGKLVKLGGFRTGVFIPEDKIRLRYVSGVSEFIRNSEKNWFAVVDYSVARSLGTALPMLLSGVLPFALLPFVRGLPLAFCLVSTAIILLAQGIACYRLGISPFYALFHPLAAMVTAFVMVRAMTLALWRGGIYWRGTFHPLDELRKGMV